MNEIEDAKARLEMYKPGSKNVPFLVFEDTVNRIISLNERMKLALEEISDYPEKNRSAEDANDLILHFQNIADEAIKALEE
jgi:ABC-type lipopolysaccharide export system ATPase subunit